MFYLFIGSVIGVVMGLTGAGGALVSLPMFMHFLHKDIKEASFLALISVVLSSIINFTFQRKNTEFKLAFFIFTASILGTSLLLPFKYLFSEFFIAVTITIISLYSLYSIWFADKKKNKVQPSVVKLNLGVILLTGSVIGMLTTLTGPGGGVVLMPICLNIFHLDEKKSLATSLFAVSLSSSFSFIMQIKKMDYIIDWYGLGYMALGVLLSVLLLKKIVSYMSIAQNQMTRKIVFTFVVLIALSKIF